MYSSVLKLDAEQSPTLAHPAAPLATCVLRHSCTKTNKIWLTRQRPLRHQKTNFRLIIYNHNYTNPKNLAKIGWVDFKITGLTGTHTHTHTRLTTLCPELPGWAGTRKVKHTRLTALCLGLPRWAGTRKVKLIWILLEQERQWVAVASAGPYANLHIAPDK